MADLHGTGAGVRGQAGPGWWAGPGGQAGPRVPPPWAQLTDSRSRCRSCSQSGDVCRQYVHVAGEQQDSEGDQYRPTDQVDQPQAAPHPGARSVIRPKASPLRRKGTPRPSE